MGVYLTSADDVVKGESGIGGSPSALVRALSQHMEMSGFPGEKKIEWPERSVADRGRRRLSRCCWGNARLVPHHLSPIKSKTQYVQGEIRQGCGNCTVSSQGWSYQTLDGRSTLRAHPRFFFLGLPTQILISPHRIPQFYSYYKQGVCCKAQSRVIYDRTSLARALRI